MNGNTNDPQLQATIERTIEVTRERVRQIESGALERLRTGECAFRLRPLISMP